MRRDDFDQTAGFRYAMKLTDEGHYVRNVFDYVPTNDQIKFVIAERIRQDTQVMNDVSVCPRVGIYSDRARIFVLPATNVKNLLGRCGCGFR
jgi:hypothetical protein